MSTLHEFKFYTTAKVWSSYLADHVKSALSKVKGLFSDPEYAGSVDQLYPSQQGVYTFNKSDPDMLIKSNKLLIDQAATILMLDERAFGQSMMGVIRYLAEYCLKLPASKYYHHVQPGSLFYHLIETGNLAAERAKAHPELMMYTDPASRSDYETIFPIGAWLLGVLHDIAKPMTDMEIIPLDKLGRPIRVSPWLASEETLYDFLIKCKAYRYKMIYREAREYHQHDAYRVWFISKLLSFFTVKSGLREPLKHIIPIHASAKHPLNYIVKEADRVSTKRDTQRYRPIPAVSNYAKAFIDVFQDFDMVKRIDEQVQLPYFFSDWAIHIPFPESVRVLIHQVNSRFAAYTDIPIPVEPDAWANLLGTEHSLLIANQRASDYRSLRYPDINRYVYDVIVDAGSESEERIRVISLSREHVSLFKEPGSRLKSVVFESTYEHDPNKVPTQPVAHPLKSSKKSPETISKAPTSKQAAMDISEPPYDIPEPPLTNFDDSLYVPNDAAPPALQFPPDMDVGVEDIQSVVSTKKPTDIRAPKASASKPKASGKRKSKARQAKSSPAESLQSEPTATVSGQVKAKIAPPAEVKRPPLAIDLSALGDLDTRQESKPAPRPAKKAGDTEAQTIPVHTESGALLVDVVTPYHVEQDDVELAIGQYLKQLPNNHVLSALFNDAVIIYDDNIKLVLWSLYNDLQQYDLSSLFAGKHRAYRIIPEGLAIHKGHLDELFSQRKEFDEQVSKHLQNELDSLMKSGKTDIYHRLFSSHKKRSYRLLNNDITTALLYKDKQALNDYFKSVEAELEQ